VFIVYFSDAGNDDDDDDAAVWKSIIIKPFAAFIIGVIIGIRCLLMMMIQQIVIPRLF
jgi:hypothetical protein